MVEGTFPYKSSSCNFLQVASISLMHTQSSSSALHRARTHSISFALASPNSQTIDNRNTCTCPQT